MKTNQLTAAPGRCAASTLCHSLTDYWRHSCPAPTVRSSLRHWFFAAPFTPLAPVRKLLWVPLVAVLLTLATPLHAQMLLNLDFGAGSTSSKFGPAGTGLSTNDFWNLYRHYDPKFTPGMPLVANGQLGALKLADRTESVVSVAVTNAPGVWGNSSGDPMYDTYIFSQNGSNIVVTLSGLAPGQYQFYLYGHADADVSGEQNSVFTLKTGTNTFGPLAQVGGSTWKSDHPWQERAQFVVFRDIPVDAGPVVIEVAPGPNGIAVLNGLQILSRGTGPPRLLSTATRASVPAATNLLFQEIRYEGMVSDTEARFTVNFTVESLSTNELSAPLFDGDVALVAPELPSGLRIVSHDGQSYLFCSTPGVHPVKLQLLARITRAEPWNQVRFTGPPAAMASIIANASTPGVELQLVSGTQLTSAGAPGAAGSSQLQGVLGADRGLALRWQGKGAEVNRKSLVTVETAANIQVTPTVIKFITTLRYEILQAPIPGLDIAFPSGQVLTRLQGEQVRDWQVRPDNGQQVLHIEFIKPVEKSATLTLFSEQSIETLPVSTALLLPQPLHVERESGIVSLSADDTTVETESSAALLQVNAPAGALAAWRFTTSPVSITAKLNRIEPILKVADRITARLEESRFLLSHTLTLDVEKAGIYGLELSTPTGFVVSAVKGDGIEDWKASDGKLKLAFSSRVLGTRKLDLQLEQANKQFPQSVSVQPLVIPGAESVTTELGAAASPGILLKSDHLTNLREIPIESLRDWAGELLAFATEQPDWKATFSAEKLAARVVADVFNLVTIGDGVVGGSATIRYGILNQGLKEFRIAVPAHWKNIEFTGANIRRKEQNTNVWTIALQEKAWGGYTLVVTYDYQFDPKGATLDLGGAHPLDVERETGSLGIMTAASLKLSPAAPAEPLRAVDEFGLSAADRSLCTHPLLFAYKYTGTYHHSMQVTRFEDVPVLDAVADRTELTSVLTEEGQLLTQSSFMVKNNEKQFQRFKLPTGSEFWSSFVNGQPAKPERDGEWFLVPLPRDANRDQAFAVDIVYAQKMDLKRSLFPHRIQLAAPLTDIPNTYGEWQLFAPASQRFSNFEGNMTVASGTTYGLHDAWQQFLAFYGNLIENHLGAIIGWFVVGLVLVLIGVALRRGVQGALTVLVLFAILAVLAAMMLPALSRAKARAQRISAVNNLKQIGLAAKTWSLDNGDAMPPNFEAMKNELSTDKVLTDPNTGQRFIYVGTGKSDAYPEAILAYSPSDVNGRAVLFADGSVQVLSQEKFEQAMQRDAAVPRTVISANTPPPATLAASSAETHAGAEVLARRYGIPSAAPAQPAVDPNTGLPVAGFGGGGLGGGAMPIAAPALSTGVRPIRIEIPRAGQAFSFMKVLNAGRQPLHVSASMMRLSTYRTLQMIFQVCAFGFGSLLLWALWLSHARNSFWMAAAASLVLWSLASLLMMWRVLHVGFIATVPALLLAVVAWAGWSYWRRHRATEPSQPSEGRPPTAAAPTAPPIMPLIFLSLLAPLLTASAGESTAPASDLVSVVSASYNGSANDKVAQLEVKLRIATAATNQTLPLFGQDVAVQSFSSQGDARLLRQGDSVGVLIPGRTNIDLQFKIVAKLGGDVVRRQLAFSMPPALSSEFNLLIDEPDADVEFPTAVAFQRESVNNQTRVQGVCGAARRLDLNWTPRVRRAAEISATVFVQNTSLITLGGGVGNTRSTFDYQVSQGELRQVRLQIPADQRVLHVEGESIRSWELKDNTLVVDLLKGVSPAYKLTVETEKLLARLPATLALEVPHALLIKRETGLLALRASEELSLAVDQSQGLQRVDADEFYRAAPDKQDGIFSAFRFLKPDFLLQVRAQAVQPQIEAVVHNQVHVGSDQIQLESQLDYTIKRAGLFALRLVIPPDYRIQSVTASNLSQWIEHAENGSRILEVTLKERTLGAWSLRCALVRNLAQVPASLVVAGVHPLGVEKLSGTLSLTTEQGLAAKTQALDGLTEIPFATARLLAGAAAPSTSLQAGGLGYRFITPEPGPAPAWNLTVTLETVDPWVRAEIMNSINFAETLVSGKTLVKYEIANAPIKELRLRIPAAFRNVDITGPQIRQRDVTNDQWRIELQGKVRGQYLLTVTWELPKSAATNLVSLSGIQALGVERETGFLALNAQPSLQLAEKSASDLLSRIDVRELPPWGGAVDSASVLAYRYLRPGFTLVVEARRFEDASVLQALIDSARFSTVVAEDGQVMTEALLNIRNNGRQHLEIQLPPDTTVWSAFVGGEPVHPSKNAGKLLLPLTRELASDAPVQVALTYVGNDPFPKYRGTLSLVSPQFDVPLKNAHWDLYLPPDYEYRPAGGTMMRTSEAGAALPAVQVYSLSEYNQQQREQEAQQKMEVRYGLESARTNLTVGNLREAIGSLSRAKARGERLSEADDAGKDLKKIEAEVRRAQSSNLVAAQNQYFYDNSARLGDKLTQQIGAAPSAGQQPAATAGRSGLGMLNEDVEVAGLQWDKLEKAQQVTVAKVAPLRVNLPTRGIHLTFGQVLQTEIGKPMTIGLLAENTKAPSWFTRIALSLLGFGLLWVVMIFINRQQRHPARTA